MWNWEINQDNILLIEHLKGFKEFQLQKYHAMKEEAQGQQ